MQGSHQKPLDGRPQTGRRPQSKGIRCIVLTDDNAIDQAMDAVGDAIDDILEGRDHSAVDVLVGTFTSSVRDRLRQKYGMVAWENLDPMAILCENVHRVKGLEYDHVILVVHDEDVSNDLLYVGASRAVMSLTVIAPPGVAANMGLG